MGKSSQEKGATRYRSLVPGQGIKRWMGVKREGSPASIPDDRFWYLQNVRLTGGRIVSRGGQSKLNTSATPGCVEGFFDAGDVGTGEYTPPPISPGSSSGCNTNGIGSPAGSRLFVIAGDGFCVSTCDYLNGLRMIPAIPAVDSTFVGEMCADTTRGIVILAGNRPPYAIHNRIYSITEDGVTAVLFNLPSLPTGGTSRPTIVGTELFIHARHTAPDPDTIVYWDGVSAVEETPGIAGIEIETSPLLASYGGLLHMIQEDTTGTFGTYVVHIVRRDEFGSYSSIHKFTDVDAGDGWLKGPNAYAVHDGKLWFALKRQAGYSDAANEIWSWNGASATMEHEIASGTLQSFFSFGDDLFYILNGAIPDAINGDHQSLGRYNTTLGTWNDTYKDLYTGVTGTGAPASQSLIYQLTEHYGYVYGTGTNLKKIFMADDPTNLAGTWTQIVSTSGTTACMNPVATASYTQFLSL